MRGFDGTGAYISVRAVNAVNIDIPATFCYPVSDKAKMSKEKGPAMTGYLYETHLHTCEASACGKVSGADYIDFMKQRGFTGMIVTDHFFTGNSCVPAYLPWPERIKLYASGFRKALESARGKDFDVLFGVEFWFEADEYLIYGVDETWLLENEDIVTCSRDEVYRRVHLAGGIMIQAHPYRERGYIPDIHLMPRISDGIEIYNAANRDNENALAYRYAKQLRVPVTAGSDIHFFHDGAMGGMLFPQRIKTIEEFVRAVLRCEGTPVRVFRGSIRPVEDFPEMLIPTSDPELPVFLIE